MYKTNLRSTHSVVNDYTNSDQFDLRSAALSSGNIALIWTSKEQDGDFGGIYCKIINDSGSVIYPEFRVSSTTVYDQSSPSLTAVSNNRFIVTWQSQYQDSSMYGIYGQFILNDYDPNIESIKYYNEFLINKYTNNDQKYPQVLSLNNGNNFLVAWESQYQDGNGKGLYYKLLENEVLSDVVGRDADDISINNETEGNQYGLSLAKLSESSCFAAWVHDVLDSSFQGEIKARYINVNGSNSDEFTVAYLNDISNTSISSIHLNNNKVMIVWSDIKPGDQRNSLYYKSFYQGDYVIAVNTSKIEYDTEVFYPHIHNWSNNIYILGCTAYQDNIFYPNVQLFTHDHLEYSKSLRASELGSSQLFKIDFANVSDNNFITFWDSDQIVSGNGREVLSDYASSFLLDNGSDFTININQDRVLIDFSEYINNTIIDTTSLYIEIMQPTYGSIADIDKLYTQNNCF